MVIHPLRGARDGGAAGISEMRRRDYELALANSIATGTVCFDVF
jgi:hypothetical protein